MKNITVKRKANYKLVAIHHQSKRNDYVLMEFRKENGWWVEGNYISAGHFTRREILQFKETLKQE